MPHYYSTSDWWVVVFLWFQSAYSGHKLSSLHVKKCSFHVTLPYKNRCKNYTNNDVDSQATPKWYIKHDIITVLLLEALERRRNASALPPLPHEKGSFCGTHFSMKNQSMSFRLFGACRGLSGLVGACRGLSGLVGACRGLSRLVGACRGLSGLVGACRGLSGLVGACRDLSGLVGTCRDLSGLVGTCRDLSGMWILWNLTLRESQLWLIKFWPNSLFLRFCGVSLSCP